MTFRVVGRPGAPRDDYTTIIWSVKAARRDPAERAFGGQGATLRSLGR